MTQKKPNESSTNNNSYLSKPRWIVKEDGSKEHHMIGYLQPKKKKGLSQEDRKLLLKDLCGRLPYGIKGLHRDKVEEIRTIDGKGSFQNYSYGAWFPIDTFKPYLRSMSNMTEEEENEYRAINCYEGLFPRNEDALDYVLSHHLDFRNLIILGLALEAPEGMYK